jgi:hypothetical protein
VSAVSVLGLFFRLLVSVSVDCGVEVESVFILDAEDEWGVVNTSSDAFPVAIAISLSVLCIWGKIAIVTCKEFEDAGQNIRLS